MIIGKSVFLATYLNQISAKEPSKDSQALSQKMHQIFVLTHSAARTSKVAWCAPKDSKVSTGKMATKNFFLLRLKQEKNNSNKLAAMSIQEMSFVT